MTKPRLYRVYYPKLKRHFWRVSAMPNRSTTTLDLWAYAHNMAREMNNHEPMKGNGMALKIDYKDDKAEQDAEDILRRVMKRNRFGADVRDKLAAALKQIVARETSK